MKFSSWIIRSQVTVLIALANTFVSASILDLNGFWLGELRPSDDGDEDNGDTLRTLFRFDTNGRESHVVMYSLDQGAGMIPAVQVSYNDKRRHLTLAFDTISGRYDATLNESNDVLAGMWHQGGYSLHLSLYRYTAQNNVPREFRFLIEKTVTGETEELQNMVGYWTGYLDDSFDQPVPMPPELVIVHVERITDDLVEPKVYLPDETAFPIGIRNFVLSSSKNIKIVLDDLATQNNAIFQGKLEGHTMTGTVKYDDSDEAPPLILTWSANRPEIVAREGRSLK